MEREYIAFISYRHTPLSKKVAKAVHSAVEQYVIPKRLRTGKKKRFGNVFRDEEELPLSSNLPDDICYALDHSEFLIVVCAKDTPDSVWVAREIEYFLSHHSYKNVFAVLAEGEPDEAYPERLKWYYDPETGKRVDIEPMGANIKDSSDNRILSNLKKEIVRLYAAMLGCPYDALVQREQKRKTKRILTAAAVIGAVVLSFTAMTVASNIKLNEKNDMLAKQQQDILLRESELLTVNAQEELEKGNYSVAAEYARDALISDGITQRPYYAEAEKTLIEAMDLFDERHDKFWILSTELTLESSVTSYACSDDGSRIVLLDRYGTVNMYSTESGELLWSAAHFDSVTKECKPLFCNDSERLIIVTDYLISAFDVNSGALLWEQATKDSHNFSGGVLAPDGSSFVYLKNDISGEISEMKYDVWLVQASCDTGSAMCEVLLAEDVDVLSIRVPEPIYTGVDPVWAVFGEDSQSVALTCIMKDKDGVRKCNYYIADLKAGTVSTIYTGEGVTDILTNVPDTPLGMKYDSENGILHIAVMSLKDKTIGELLSVEASTGKVLWRTAAPEVEDEFFTASEFDSCVMFSGNALVMSGKEYIYVFTLKTGECLGQGVLDSKVISISKVNNDDVFVFSYITQKGKYAYAWINDLGVVSSDYLGNSMDLGQELVSGNTALGGSFMPVVKDGRMEDPIIGSENEGLGYITVISADNGFSVKVIRAVPVEVEEKEKLKVMGEGENSINNIIACGEDLIAVGPLKNYDDEAQTAHYNIVNTESGEIVASLPCPDILTSEEVYILPDMKGWIKGFSYGDDLVMYNASEDSCVTLVKDEKVELGLADNVQFSASRFLNTGTVLGGSYDVIAASTDGTVLNIWKNGEKLTEKDLLAEGINWYVETFGSRLRFIKSGGNGFILLSDYDDYATEDALDRFAAYSIKDDRFYYIYDVSDGSYNRKISLAEKKDLFAVMDEDKRIRIYDISEGEVLTTVVFPLASNSVSVMSFVYGDRYLMVTTQDKQVFFFDVSTGECLFRNGIGFYDCKAVADEKNGRIYVYSDYECICIETYSWQVIATAKYVYHYDPHTNRLYADDYSGSLRVFSIPSTKELLDMTAKKIAK